jgi:cold-inducible RNA-binding protein
VPLRIQRAEAIAPGGFPILSSDPAPVDSVPQGIGKESMKKIFVGNLSFNMTDGELRSMFEPFGAVESVLIVTDRNTGRSRGFGFVEMSDNGAADQAIAALNGKDQGGRALTVNEARPKMDRGGPRGGGGGGGRRDDYRGHARQPREPRW